MKLKIMMMLISSYNRKPKIYMHESKIIFSIFYGYVIIRKIKREKKATNIATRKTRSRKKNIKSKLLYQKKKMWMFLLCTFFILLHGKENYENSWDIADVHEKMQTHNLYTKRIYKMGCKETTTASTTPLKSEW